MPAFDLRLLRQVAILTAIAMAAGCGTVGGTGWGRSDPYQEARPTIEQLKADGDYRAVAQVYLQLEGNAEQTREWRLRAAEALVRAGDIPGAVAIARPLDVARLTADQRARRQVIMAEEVLAAGDPGLALTMLPQLSPDLSSAAKIQILETRIRVFRATGRPDDVLLDLLSLDKLLPDGRQRADYRDELWLALGDVPEERKLSLVSVDPDLAGWLALYDIGQVPLDDASTFNNRMTVWWTRFPGHPATQRARLMADARSKVRPVSRVALLLPLSGQYASAADEVRSGFMAQQQDSGSSVTVITYDTTTADAAQLYQQALTEGAEAVVGPLRKSAVEAIARLTQLPVPVLALNRVSTHTGTPQGELYQFGLAPEDEAEQVAAHALELGFNRALVVSADGDWGQRVSDAFVNRYEAGGGSVLESVSFSSDEVDFSEPIKKLLLLDGSENRHKALGNALGRKLEFEPRRRQDVDFVFMAAVADHARLLNPQLRFYQANDLPVLATSSVYAGSPDPRRDQDLNGVSFCDMPWILVGPGGESAIQTGQYEPNDGTLTAFTAPQDPASGTNAGAEPATPSEAGTSNLQAVHFEGQGSRLYALGYDAYSVLPWLAALQSAPGTSLEGVTGELYGDGKGHINRRLLWARFAEGIPSVSEQPGSVDESTIRQ